MGTAERKNREKAELRGLILKAARDLFVQKGIEQTTIRKIATAIDYSVGTVYVYFKDKNDILHALHTQGFGQLGNEMRTLHTIAEPMERLIALGKVYIKFALENPDMYELMFSLRAPIEFLESSHKECWNEGKATFDVLRTNVAQCLEAGYFKGQALEPLSFAIWSMVHGMASLHISQRTRGVNLMEPEVIINQAYEAFVLMIREQI
ncbi:TetR/AcrR family transcriptional regulator [Eisenibacter elegans]|jgi:AcrR family transcriptional regulator|uniref:TetR/AcrR family transcriptional regulator n=1 Tax=Eisenibacter elegans TaxID=997 RepID=UPI00041D0A7B|nr:TetR/AcrR family transcriptional regulator [Eisenibacter elegans]